MLSDLMTAMSHMDWVSRRQRQKHAIEREHSLGNIEGSGQIMNAIKKVLHYCQVKKLSIREAADATGYSTSLVCRIQAHYKSAETD